MKMNDKYVDLTAYIATLVAIVLLSKIGGTGADLAVMTGLVGVLGVLAGQKLAAGKKDAASGKPGDPVHIEEDRK